MSKDHFRLSSKVPVDVYFYNAADVAACLPYNARVVYRYFARKSGMFFGTPFIKRLIENHCKMWNVRSRPKLKALPEGTLFEGRQIIMEIEWTISHLIAFETAILGILSQSGTAANMHALVSAARGRPVYAFEARHFPPEMAELTACAAKLGGASGTSSTTGAETARDYPYGSADFDYTGWIEGHRQRPEFASSPTGTTPHACSAIMPMTEDAEFVMPEGVGHIFQAPADLPEVRCAEVFANIKPDKPCLVLNDYSGRELDASRAAVRYLDRYPNFWGVRCDTCGERFHQGAKAPQEHSEWAQLDEQDIFEWEQSLTGEQRWESGRGVTVEQVKNVRRVMDEESMSKLAKIMVSSGFNPMKTFFFDAQGAPFDAVGSGSFVEFLGVTSDIVAVAFGENEKLVHRVKAGREWLANQQLKGLEEWRWE